MVLPTLNSRISNSPPLLDDPRERLAQDVGVDEVAFHRDDLAEHEGTLTLIPQEHQPVSASGLRAVWYAFPRPKTSEGAFVDSQIWLGGLVSVRIAVGFFARGRTARRPPPEAAV